MSHAAAGRELHVRYLRKDGRSVAVLRTVDYLDSCAVEAEVFPPSGTFPERPGPYSFGDPSQATAFLTEAVEALVSLGCDLSTE
jgi:hypothetical protein